MPSNGRDAASPPLAGADGGDVPPLHVSLAAMDDRINVLTTALTALSGALRSPSPGSSPKPASSPARVPNFVSQASTSDSSDKELNQLREDLKVAHDNVEAYEDENKELKAKLEIALEGNPTVTALDLVPAERGEFSPSASPKSMLAEIERLKSQVENQKSEICNLETAGKLAAAGGAGYEQPDMMGGGGLGSIGEDGGTVKPKVMTRAPGKMRKMKKLGARNSPRGRRLSLASSLRTQGQEKMSRIETMVELLTTISSARDLTNLITVALTGVTTLLAPFCSCVSLWVAHQNKTFLQYKDAQKDTADGMSSFFMKAVLESGSHNKVNVKASEYKLYLGSKAHPEDVPQSVLALPVTGAHNRVLAIIEVRNAGRPGTYVPEDWATEDEEILAAVVSQISVTLNNVLYNKRVEDLQKFDLSAQLDEPTLKKRIVESGKELFSGSNAVDVIMASADHSKNTFSLTSCSEAGRDGVIPFGAGVVWTVYSTRVSLMIEDLSSSDHREALTEELCLSPEENGHTGQRHRVSLQPIIANDKVLGVLAVLMQLPAVPEEEDATEQEESQLQMFAGQSAVLLSNCQMYQSALFRAEQIKHKVDLLDVSKAFASELHEEDLSTTIIERTRAVLDCDRCALFLFDDGGSKLWSRLQDGSTIEMNKHEGIAGWVATNGKMCNIPDAYSDSRFNSHVDQKTKYHTQSILAVPVRNSAKELTGVIQMVNKRGGHFTSEDEDVLQMIASQAGVSLNNARMYETAVKGQRNFNVLLDISKKLSSELDTTVLIQNICHSAKDLLQCDRSTLFLVDKERKQLWSKVADGLAKTGVHALKEIRMPLHKGIAGMVATTGDVANIPDVYEVKSFNRGFDEKTGYRTCSILCVPIQNSKGEVLGVMQMINKFAVGGSTTPTAASKRGGKDGSRIIPFETGDENLLKAFSSQAAVSIENAQLFERALEDRNFLQSVLSSIKNLVIAFDHEGRLITCNHSLEKYFGMRQALVSKLHFTKWLQDYEPLMADIELCISGRELVEGGPIEVNGVWDNEQTEFTMNYSCSPLSKTTGGASTHDSATAGDDKESAGCVIVFDDMTEKKLMKATLGRYLSSALVNQVLDSGQNVLGGVRQKVSVVFSDIRSFTTISENMDAVDLVGMLNEYFGFMIPPIFDNFGVLDKFIGDAIMAVFGVPFVSDDGGTTDAIRAAKCALEMIVLLDTFNKQRLAKNEIGLAIGIGINTGKVVSGNIGSDQRMEYTVIGDGVNLASRLEGITKTYGVPIVMSEYTNDDVCEVFITRELDTVAVKGKDDGVKIFELVAVRPEAAGVPLNDKDPAHGSLGGDELTKLMKAAYDDRARVLAIAPHIERFENALQTYRRQDFKRAIAEFESIKVDAPNDRPCELFIDRCKEYLIDPPPKDWDGVYRPKSK